MKKIYLSMFAIALLVGAGFALQVRAESKSGNDRNEDYNEVGLKFGVEAGMGMGKMMSDDNNELQKEKRMGEYKPRIFGTVTAVSGNTITITSKGFGPNAASITYTVDATNAKIEKAGVAGSIASIVVGDSISVEGTINGTTVVATSIKDGKGKSGEQNTILEGNGQPIVGGVVTAVSGSTITIKNKSNIIYTIDATNAKINKAGKAITTSDVVVGDTILAQGTINGTSVVAVSIIDQSNTTNNKNGDNGNHRGFFRKMGDFFSRMFGF